MGLGARIRPAGDDGRHAGEAAGEAGGRLMPQDQLLQVLAAELAELVAKGTAKGVESVVTGVLPATATRGPRFRLAGHGDTEFLRMNSNSYLGISFQPEVIAAEERMAHLYGSGPGAVRFISGT